MAYAIGYFVYGNIIPRNIFDSWGIEVEDHWTIFDQYHGDAEGEILVAVELAQIDECSSLDAAGVASLVHRLFPADLSRVELKGKLDTAAESVLPDAAKEYIKDLIPTVFLVWGTS